MFVFNIVFHMVIASLHLDLHLGYPLSVRSCMKDIGS